MLGWQTPKTNWTKASHVGYYDMNRIGGNLNWLLNGSTEEVVKETWTNDDFVTLADWKAVISAIKALAIWVGLTNVTFPGTSLSASNFNLAESAILRLKAPVELRRAQENRYLNDGVFASMQTLMEYVGGGY